MIAAETRAGRPAHLVVCSRGESATHGTPDERAAREPRKAAALLGATLEFIELDGDAHLEVAGRPRDPAGRRHPAASARASCWRRPWSKTSTPTTPGSGRLVRDAARLARYGGVEELRDLAPHAIEQLFFYAVTPEAEPRDVTPC